MSDRFTEYAKEALENALNIANELGSGYVGTEHILLALMLGQSVAARVLSEHGAGYEPAYRLVAQSTVVSCGMKVSAQDMSPRLRSAIAQASAVKEKYGSDTIGTEHILLAILEEDGSGASKVLKRTAVSVSSLKDELRSYMLIGSKARELIKSQEKKTKLSALEKYGKDLCALARQGEIESVIGREKECERLLQILCRKNKNNPCLVGDPGVGKTAVVEGLAWLIAQNKVPDLLKKKRIFSVDLSSLIAGARYRGEFEERLRDVINEAKSEEIILFIDEIHTLVGAGAAEGAVDGANILKPPLSRGEIRLIGATTFLEYKKYIEKDSALERRFAKIVLKEPDRECCIRIMQGIKERYERYHGIKIEDEALVAAVDLSIRFITDRFLPDKAIDLLDESASRLKVEGTARESNGELLLTAEEIEKTASLQIGGLLTEECLDPKERLLDVVYGQEEAVEKMALVIKGIHAGLHDPEKPLGSYLFAGQNRFAKNEMARGIARILFHSEQALIKVDLSEYTERHSVSTLIGAPPGYVGFEEGGKLTEKVRRSPRSLLYFENAEKAHGDVVGLLAGILERGELEDASGRLIDFRNCIIIFTVTPTERLHTIRMPGSQNGEEGEAAVLQNLERQFPKEILRRVDDIIVFQRLSLEALSRAVRNVGKKLEMQAQKEGYTLKIGDALFDGFVRNHADRLERGEEDVQREFTGYIRRLIAKNANGQVKGRSVRVDLERGTETVWFDEEE